MSSPRQNFVPSVCSPNVSVCFLGEDCNYWRVGRLGVHWEKNNGCDSWRRPRIQENKGFDAQDFHVVSGIRSPATERIISLFRLPFAFLLKPWKTLYHVTTPQCCTRAFPLASLVPSSIGLALLFLFRSCERQRRKKSSRQLPKLPWRQRRKPIMGYSLMNFRVFLIWKP